jgi:hypothetical protein
MRADALKTRREAAGWETLPEQLRAHTEPLGVCSNLGESDYARLWRQGWPGILQSPVYLIIWAIAVSLSALATHSATYTLLAQSPGLLG